MTANVRTGPTNNPTGANGGGGILDIGEAEYEEGTESGLAAYDPAVHGMPKPLNRGVVRIAGVEWLDRAECSWDDDPDAWQLDPSEVVGDPPVPVKLTGSELLRVEHARTGCALCPVQAECKSLSEESETVPVGIWYGLDWAERGGVTISAAADRMAAVRIRGGDERRKRESAARRARRQAAKAST